MAQENKTNNSITEFFSKAGELGKKVANGITKSVKDLSNSTQKSLHDQKVKKYNPLFAEKFKSEEFTLPNIIEIVDDAVRRNIDICEGAIGWIDKVGGVEVLHLYDEYVLLSGVEFIPFVRCDAIYCVDPFDRNKFINTESTFERTINEKLAELEHIAYCLGAKSCSIEIVENDAQLSSLTANIKVAEKFVDTKITTENKNQKKQSAKNISQFSGNEKPRSPQLKWFAYDENVKGLIKMRLTGKNLIKAKTLELQCSMTATMSHKTAVAIDKIKKVKADLSMEVKSVKEHSSKLIFEVLF